MDSYFRKFPTISYNGQTCVDISRSARLTEQSRLDVQLYSPVELTGGFRADNLASAYYQDSERDWLIWLANGMIDPFYDWYLSELDFEAFIQTKYGGVQEASERILYYQNNWSKLEETITPQHYDNYLPFSSKKYYTPNFGLNNKIIEYKRKEENWITNTNRMMSFTFDSDVAFEQGELIDLKKDGAIVGGGEIVTANSSQIVYRHVDGNTTANSTYSKTIVGRTSGFQANSNQSNSVFISIQDDEAVYWEPVSYYDWEFLNNERKKEIYVINADFAMNISEQLRLMINDR